MKEIDTSLANDIDATDGKSKYDAQVKKFWRIKLFLHGY